MGIGKGPYLRRVVCPYATAVLVFATNSFQRFSVHLAQSHPRIDRRIELPATRPRRTQTRRNQSPPPTLVSVFS